MGSTEEVTQIPRWIAGDGRGTFIGELELGWKVRGGGDKVKSVSHSKGVWGLGSYMGESVWERGVRVVGERVGWGRLWPRIVVGGGVASM